MKSTLLLTALTATLLGAGTAQAQVPVVSKIVPKFALGIKAGANFQTLSCDGWQNTYKPGILGGIFAEVWKGKWGVQAEGMVKSARFDINTSTVSSGSGYIKTVSVDVPVLAEYKIVSRLWVQAGPQFSSVLSAKDNGKNDVKKVFKSSDVSGVVGLELKLPLHLRVGARYILGFSDINNHASVAYGNEAWRNRYAQLYIGFKFI